MSAETQRTFDAFVREFVVPLLEGKSAKLGRFLTPKMLSYFSLASPTDNEIRDALIRGLRSHASSVYGERSLHFPDRGSAAMLMALHNLAALTDPLLDRAFARGSRGRVLGWVDTLTDAIDVPATRGAALVRHVILKQTLSSSRQDTVVKNWAYTYRFFGRRPPANVVAMPKLRFVREEHTQRPLETLISDAELDLQTPIERLISRSPITHLLAHRQGFRFGAADLAVLSDEGLRFGIVQEIVQSGTQRAAHAFGAALRALAECDVAAPFLRTALLFCVEVQLLEVLDDRRGTAPTSVPDVSDEELFSALLPALLELHDEGHPIGARIALSSPDMDEVRHRALLRAEQAGADAVETARALCLRVASRDEGPRAGLGWQ